MSYVPKQESRKGQRDEKNTKQEANWIFFVWNHFFKWLFGSFIKTKHFVFTFVFVKKVYYVQKGGISQAGIPPNIHKRINVCRLVRN